MPVPARTFAANLRGLYLRWWRYGPDTPRLVDEALERERWGRARWRAYQDERLARLLHRAATRVPFYRDAWERRRRRGDTAPFEALENWPVLRKETVRENPRAFVADDRDVRFMLHEQTSGTTGMPMHLWWTREVAQAWYALYEARIRRWNGVSVTEPWAILGGQLVVPFDRRTPPFWVHNRALRQLYLSSFHLAPRHAEAYAETLNRHRPTHLVGYPSSVALLASMFLARQIRVDGLRVFLSNAEYLTDSQRDIIGRGLGVRVRNSYGMGEIVAGASECDAGTLHLWPEVGWHEILDDSEDRPAPPDAVGRFVFTGLLNPDMPLVRYEVGDRGRIDHPAEGCACGRDLPRVASIEGRLSDLIVTPDGRRVFWLNPVLYSLPIREAQIVQEELDRIRVLCVPGAGFVEGHATLLVERLRQRLGSGVRIEVERVSAVERTASGKVKAVVSKVRIREAAADVSAGPVIKGEQ